MSATPPRAKSVITTANSVCSNMRSSFVDQRLSWTGASEQTTRRGGQPRPSVGAAPASRWRRRSRKVGERMEKLGIRYQGAGWIAEKSPRRASLYGNGGLLCIPCQSFRRILRIVAGESWKVTCASPRSTSTAPWRACVGWRRGWDSNPRSSYPDYGFRDRPIRPLSHLSVLGPQEVQLNVVDGRIQMKSCAWMGDFFLPSGIAQVNKR